MSQPNVQPPLSNVQQELLRLFPANIPEKNLLELRKLIAQFLLDKARDQADKTWSEKKYSDSQLQQILQNT